MFLDKLRQEKDLDWTFLSPSALIEIGERTGKFRLGGDQLLTDANGKSRITFEDFAIAMVDEVEKPNQSASALRWVIDFGKALKFRRSCAPIAGQHPPCSRDAVRHRRNRASVEGVVKRSFILAALAGIDLGGASPAAAQAQGSGGRPDAGLTKFRPS